MLETQKQKKRMYFKITVVYVDGTKHVQTACSEENAVSAVGMYECSNLVREADYCEITKRQYNRLNKV